MYKKNISNDLQEILTQAVDKMKQEMGDSYSIDNRGRRYETGPGESYQMDWGFVNVDASDGSTYKVMVQFGAEFIYI